MVRKIFIWSYAAILNGAAKAKIIMNELHECYTFTRHRRNISMMLTPNKHHKLQPFIIKADIYLSQ